ncbi:helix-turn-helix transcriptional regulator [Clostridium sp. KNHs216]|uniref:helix-turn-helix domain-containing protein n=1 Tax=Clostridium sp. KNHs216 TaxID=1550235 RepID=UPI0011508F00|nr:helix-turn-helix transcriptional regulator [Clostridium sp. KNHs216]TQI68876.1 helix-turn-helix protein [Clostridium sp. KNHs216]
MKLRIRDIREDRDLTQKQIADYLMCDQSLYSKYEREERGIPLHLIVRLARYYRVSVDYLVSLTNTKTPYPMEGATLKS